MWRRKPVFQCCLCKSEAPARKVFTDDSGSMGWFPPKGWSGEFKKNGTCFCDKCTKAIEITKGSMYAESE